mgnify:CR=1 FL=1
MCVCVGAAPDADVVSEPWAPNGLVASSPMWSRCWGTSHLNEFYSFPRCVMVSVCVCAMCRPPGGLVLTVVWSGIGCAQCPAIHGGCELLGCNVSKWGRAVRRRPYAMLLDGCHDLSGCRRRHQALVVPRSYRRCTIVSSSIVSVFVANPTFSVPSSNHHFIGDSWLRWVTEQPKHLRRACFAICRHGTSPWLAPTLHALVGCLRCSGVCTSLVARVVAIVVACSIAGQLKWCHSR